MAIIDQVVIADIGGTQVDVTASNALKMDGSAVTQPVSAASLPLPTGAATAANQSTLIGHVDGIEGLLTTIDADTGNISTKIDTLAGAVSGTEFQVDVLTLPAITGSVSISGSIDTELPTAAALADNTANPTVPGIGSFLMGYDGTNWDRVRADGGALFIQDGGNSITVDNGGTFAVQAAQSGTWNINNISGTISLPTGASTLSEQQTQTTHLATIAGDTTDIETAVELIDDTVVTLGTTTYTEATSKGLVIGGVRRDADTTLVNTTNEFAPFQVDANGRLKVEAFSGETLPVSLISTTITGTVAVTQSGTWDEVGINDSGNSITVDAPTGTPVNVQIGDGTRQATVRDTGSSDSLNVAIVDGSGNHITSFGGGTQYTEGDTDATITGTAILWEDTSDTLTSVSASKPLPVNVIAGSAASTEYTEDAAATANPVGGAIIVVRDDARGGSLTTTDGDNVALRGTNAGELYVKHVDTIPVTKSGTWDITNAGTFAVQLTGATNNINNISGTVSLPTGAATETTLASLLTSSQLIDDTIIILGTDTYSEATSKGQILAAVRRDADTTLVNTTNEYGPLQMDANGRLKVEAFSGETLPVSLTSTTITGTVAVTQSGTWDEIGINDSGNSITVDNNGTFVTQIDGAALTALQLIDDSIFVDNAAFTDNSSKVSVAGFYFDETAGTALTENDVAAARIDSKRALINVIEDATTRGTRMGVVDETGTNAVDAAAVGGGTPHDSVDSGNPLKLGGRAIAHGTNPTAVAADDRTHWYFNRHGIPFVMGGHPNAIRRTVYISDATGAQTDASIVGTINAGTKVVVTSITVTLDSATTATGGVAAKVGFGASTIPADSSTGANGIVLDHKGIAAGSGVSIGDGSGIIGIGADGEELRLTCEDPVGGGLSVSFTYYTIES